MLHAAVTAPLGWRHPHADGSRACSLTILLRLNITILMAATPLILNPEAARCLWQPWHSLGCFSYTITVRNQQGSQLLTIFTF